MCDFLSSDVGIFYSDARIRCVGTSVWISWGWVHCGVQLYMKDHMPVSTDLIKNANIVLQRREINILQKKARLTFQIAVHQSLQWYHQKETREAGVVLLLRIFNISCQLGGEAYRKLKSCLLNVGPTKIIHNIFPSSFLFLFVLYVLNTAPICIHCTLCTYRCSVGPTLWGSCRTKKKRTMGKCYALAHASVNSFENCLIILWIPFQMTEWQISSEETSPMVVAAPIPLVK